MCFVHMAPPTIPRSTPPSLPIHRHPSFTSSWMCDLLLESSCHTGAILLEKILFPSPRLVEGFWGPTPLSVLGIWSSSCLYKCMLSQPVWVHRHSCPAVFPSGLRAMQPYVLCTLTSCLFWKVFSVICIPHTHPTLLSQSSLTIPDPF